MDAPLFLAAFEFGACIKHAVDDDGWDPMD